MTTMRFGIAAVGLALLAMGGGACNLIDFDSRSLQDQPEDMPPPRDTPEPESRTCPVVAEATPEYEAMCRHYCNELEATLTYSGQNQEPAGAVARSCWELRCVPRCVTRELCDRQCHPLGYAYQEMCRGVEIGPDSICPVATYERVAACSAGCEAWAPPVDPNAPPPPVKP
jgi:hypothetical protein